MSYLDVISVNDVNSWLSLDLDPEDVYADREIQRLIKTAIDWVENYTSHLFYERQKVVANSKCDQSFAWYPIKTIMVTTQTDEAVTFKTYAQPTKLRVTCPYDSKITLTAGYATPADIPGPLVDACYKLITYLYENRDMYTAQLPSDVQVLINQYRRALI